MEKKYDDSTRRAVDRFCKTGKVSREISYLKHVRVEHHVMYLQC